MSEAVSVTATARALGLTVGRSGSNHWLSPCPKCGAARQHTKSRDRRGAITVRRDDLRWKCWQCEESGDANWLAKCAGKGRPAAQAPEPLPALDFLDPGEARRFWYRCAHARARPSVAAWLDGLRLGQAFCARALPLSADEFRWASGWHANGHHIVFGLHDGTGRLRNYLARAVVPGAAKKSLAAHGVRRAGLVLADQLGVDLLRGHYDGPCLVVEGEKKLLISEHLSAGRWATIGTGSGMWSDEVAAAVSRASHVLVSTDPDESGLRYARRVVASVSGCVLRPELALHLESGMPSAEADDDVWAARAVPWYVATVERLTSPGSSRPEQAESLRRGEAIRSHREKSASSATFTPNAQVRGIAGAK